MVVTLGQQYNVGEKPIVILYTYINRHARTPDKKQKQKQCSTSSNMVVIIYFYIGCKDKATTWYLNGFPKGIYLPWVYSMMWGRSPLYTYINCHAEPPNIELKPYNNNSNIGSTVQYIVGEKPIVILYNYVDRHARTPH